MALRRTGARAGLAITAHLPTRTASHALVLQECRPARHLRPSVAQGRTLWHDERVVVTTRKSMSEAPKAELLLDQHTRQK
jgi:hypothetical protein